MPKTIATIERRFYKCNLRMAGDDPEQRVIEGHGAVFDSPSENLGGFQEMIMPGAFSQAILEDDIRSLFNHNVNLILGRNTSSTLRLFDDDTGLRYELDPPQTSYANDLIISLERGDISQSSFGFRAIEESWRQPDENNPLPVRVLHRVKLFDVGPVAFPAYQDTTVSARALDQAQELSTLQTPPGYRTALQRRRLNLLEMS